MVEYLSETPQMKTIWSEVSYLDRWINDVDDAHQKMFRTIVERGQLELVSGGWVMTDEATPYFWASIDNIIEGHRYLDKVLSIRPKYSWSVDPFGHGAMMPYLNQLAGIRASAIGRINEEVKEKMRHQRLLVFNWTQAWGT